MGLPTHRAPTPTERKLKRWLEHRPSGYKMRRWEANLQTRIYMLGVAAAAARAGQAGTGRTAPGAVAS